ncbi:DegV family protein, partial [Streptococcus danieliae]|nr:DegV family protein [Streptococcus danieliae]
TISAALSGSHNAAKVAKEMYLEENPTAKVYVIDSLLAGGGLDVIALKLNELIKQGLEFEEIVKEITEYQKNAKLTFILSKVDNLIKN